MARVDYASGDLGGAMMMTGSAMAQGGVLAIGLQERNNSGESGIALLHGMATPGA
jgi:hypothetical protein